MCAPLVAQPAEPAPEGGRISESIDELIALLDAPDHETRVRATALLGDPGIGVELETLARAAVDAPPERAIRLRSSMLDLFSRSPKAGLGVGFGPDIPEGVPIQTVVEEVDAFPGAALLRPGDLVMGADGLAVETPDELRIAILSHKPGESLQLLLRRQGEALTIDAPLGDYKELNGAAPIHPSIAYRAIERRLARAGIEPRPTRRVTGAASIDRWLDAAYPGAPIGIVRSRAPGHPGITIGGDGRDAYSGLGSSRRTLVSPWITRQEASLALRQSARTVLARRMHALELRIRSLTEHAEALARRGEDPGGELDALRRDIEDLREEIARANAEFEALGDDGGDGG